MKQTAEYILYTSDDSQIVSLAEGILGNRNLRLSLEEAVAVIREHYPSSK